MTERSWEATPGREFVGRLEKGSDLVAELERICTERDVSAAWVSVIGAVSHAASPTTTRPTIGISSSAPTPIARSSASSAT